jgi:hypothetical protein
MFYRFCKINFVKINIKQNRGKQYNWLSLTKTAEQLNKKIMKKAIITILTFGAINIYAQKIKPVHFSVIQGVSTEGKESKNNDYHFSLNMLSGTVRNINGVELGSIYNQNEGNMTGLQASGILNITKGTVRGYQTAGITNITGDVIGIQHAGINNIAKNVMGIQNSGIVNMAEKVNGFQITGIYNQTKVLKGLQIGLINKADTVEKGGGIGLLNFYKVGGYREVEISAADYQNIGISYKSGTKSIYSIFNIGYNYNPTSLLSCGFGLGTIKELNKNWYFKPEIMSYSYFTNDFNFNNDTQSNHLKLGFMRKMGNMGLTISPSIYYSNIPRNLDGELTEISRIKPISQTREDRWGFGLSMGLAFLK